MPDQPKLKLLVPYSFNPKSDMALDYALTYATGVASEIYIFHVFEDATKNFRRLDELNEEYMEKMKNVVLTAIKRLHNKGVTTQVEDVHRRLAFGKAAVEILKMADGIAADMLIMGLPTAKQFKKLLASTPCSLILLKKKDHA